MSDSSRPALGDRVRYHVDRFMSWSPIARFVGLFVLSFLLVSVCALLAMLVMPSPPEDPFDFFEALWWSMTRVADAGTMGDDKGTLVRTVAVLSTLSGVMVVALLIGLVSSTIGEKIDDLRKGRSPVIDEDHTLILGYGEKVFTLLRELREANRSRRSASVVILSEADKEEVETAVRERMGDMATTRVIVRQGSPFSPADLKKVGAGRARSIVVLADGESHEDEVPGQADMSAIKTLLALRRVNGALTHNHATIELLEGGRRNVVERLGAGGVEVVAMRDTLSRLMVQTVRQRGVAEVYRGLLSYEGSEFYFQGFRELDGVAFSAVQPRLKDAVAVGVRRVEADGEVKCLLNPPEDFVLRGDDQLLVLAEDDDTFGLVAERPIQVPQFDGAQAAARKPERILICGFGDSVRDVLRELDNYVLQGSEVCLMPGRPKEEVAEVLDVRRLQVKNLSLKFVEGDPVSPEALRPLARLDFSAALIVADDRFPPQEADARTVISVLLLRELFGDAMEKTPRIISELLDPRTKDLLETDGAADFVVSSEITSMLLAQVSERRELNAVFADLFDSDGNEIYLKRASCYAPLGAKVGWLTVQKIARRRGEVAIGFVRGSTAPVLNPKQDEVVAFGEADRIIVIAEDDNEAGAPAQTARSA